MSETANAALSCSYCGLPVTPGLFAQLARSRTQASEPTGQPQSAAEPMYCCFGCRFAAEVTRARGEEGAARWTLTSLGLSVFFTMNVLVFSMALWGRDVYETPAAPGAVAEAASAQGSSRGAEPGALAATVQQLFRYLCLLLALPVLFLLGGPLLANAWESLRGGALAADLLLVIGVAASYLYSAMSVWSGGGHIYFEVGCVVLVLVTLGRWLEAVGKLKTTEAIESLHKLLPETARVVRPGGETMVPVGELSVGDQIRVLPGERFATDGRVCRGSAAIAEELLTGESHPVTKEPGDAVFAGTTNLDGDLFVEVVARVREGTMARLVELVRKACRSRGHYERLADRIASWFIPLVTLIAAMTFVVHWTGEGLERGILTGLAVLLIACPCALGIATPMAVWAALGTAARNQLLFRNGEALERLARVRAVRFDKTGTLTTGTPVMIDFLFDAATDPDELLEVAARLGAASSHSLARAIPAVAIAGRQTPVLANTEGFGQVRTLAGRGVVGTDAHQGLDCYLGSVRLMDEMKLDWPTDGVQARSLSEGQTDPTPLVGSLRDAATRSEHPVVCVGWDGMVRGVFRFREQLRPEALQAVARLRAAALDVRILTGDHAARGAAIERELGITVEAELLPEDKVAAVERTHAAIGPVAMVGDGINDAPALAASDVGIALGCGADVARDAAAVCLLTNNLQRLPWAVDLSRRTVRVIRQNLFWAFAYNIVGIGFAASGHLNPVLAALAMVVSSALVVSNSLRLNSRAGSRNAI